MIDSLSEYDDKMFDMLSPGGCRTDHCYWFDLTIASNLPTSDSAFRKAIVVHIYGTKVEIDRFEFRHSDRKITWI